MDMDRRDLNVSRPGIRRSSFVQETNRRNECVILIKFEFEF